MRKPIKTQSKNHKISILDPTLLAIFITNKVVTIGVILVSFCFSNRHNINIWNRWYTGPKNLDAFYLPFANWDGQHYLLLADWGYDYWDHSQAFFPLYPGLIHLINYFIPNIYLSAFLLNMVLSYIFVYLFFLYSSHFLSQKISIKATVLVLCYPTAFFLSVFYSEALFLVALFGFIYFYEIKRSYYSIIFAIIMPLTKGQAFFIMIAMAILFFWKIIRKKSLDCKYEILNISGFIIGGLLYFIFFFYITGSPFNGLEEQKSFVFENKISSIFNPIHLIHYLTSPSTKFFAYTNSLNDKLFIFICFFLSPLIVLSRQMLWILFYFMLFYPVAAMGSGGSFSRFTLVLFPFISICIWKFYADREKIIYSFTFLFLILQVYFVYRFSLNLWVA